LFAEQVDRIRQDIEAARAYLEGREQVKVVAAKGGRIIGWASGSGVRPVLELAEGVGEALQGASVADRVIGRAAGFVLVAAGVRGAYGAVLSEEAQRLLTRHGIVVQSGLVVPYIQRRDGAGRCVMEEQVLDLDDPEQAVERLRQLLRMD
jgi:hypothetical protein